MQSSISHRPSPGPLGGRSELVSVTDDRDRSRRSQTDTLVFVADHWGGHPSSAQHLARRMSPDLEVVWLETVGMTAPSLDRDSARRGADQLMRWMAGNRPTPMRDESRVRVLSPWHWPSWGSSRLRRWNGRLLARSVTREVSTEARRTLVTTLPLAATLLDYTRFDRIVYYCVDEFSSWPGADREVQLNLERRLLSRCDVVIAASRRLQERFADLGYEAHFLPHGVDAAHWDSGRCGDSAAAALRQLPRPLLLFWGLIDRRLDVDWVRACQRACNGTVVLLGPQRSPDRELLRLPGVVCPGSVPYTELPACAAASDALIMPYADLPVTQFMQPLKLLEYLCTDRPVVMRDLPACREWADAADLAATADELCAALVRRLRDGVPAAQMTSRRRARSMDWSIVAARFRELVSPRDGDATTSPGGTVTGRTGGAGGAHGTI